jgi:hypothetical protein
VECHRTQNERDGTSYPIPPLFARGGGFAPNIALALVVVCDLKITQCVWFERTTVELMMCGRDPEGAIFKDSDFILYLLRQQGVTGINCKVPTIVSKPIGRRLKRAGFSCEDGRFSNFFKDLSKEQL